MEEGGGWLTGPSLSSTIDPPMASQLTMQTKHLKKGLLSTAGSLKKGTRISVVFSRIGFLHLSRTNFLI